MDDTRLRTSVAELMKRRLLDPGAPAYSVAQKLVFGGYNALRQAEKNLCSAAIFPLLLRHRPLEPHDGGRGTDRSLGAHPIGMSVESD